MTRSITTTDLNATGGTVIGTPKNFTTTYVAQVYNFTDGVQYNSVNPSNGALYFTQNFCEPAPTTAELDAGGNPVYRLTTTSTASTIFRFGFNYTCTPTTMPVGWTLAI